MVELFDKVYHTLIETTPKLGLEKYDLVKKATDAVEKKFYPALSATLDLDYKPRYQIDSGEIDAAFFKNASPILAVEHENRSDGFVAQEVYKLLTMENPFRYNIAITYETERILRDLILSGAGFLYRELRSDLKAMIILGSAPYTLGEPWIQWRRCELDSEGSFVVKHCTEPLPTT
jgi:hypothetical protein